MGRAGLVGRTGLVGILLTLALYLSGFFVLLTPLPPLYHWLVDRRRALWGVVLPIFAILVFVYAVLLDPLARFYQAHPAWSWLLPIPGMNFRPFLSSRTAALFGLVYFLFFVGVAGVVQHILSRPVHVTRVLGGAALVFSAAGLLLYAGYASIQGISPFGFASDYIQLVINEFIQVQEKAGLPLSRLAVLRENAPLFARIWLLFSPSILFCAVLFILVLNLAVGKKILSPFVRSIGRVSLNATALEFFWVWAVIFCVGVLLLNSFFFRQTWLLAASANILLVLIFAYFLQGLAIVSWFFEKRNVGSLVRLLLYGLIVVLFQIVGVLVTGLGFFDSWFDFRKLSRPPGQKKT